MIPIALDITTPLGRLVIPSFGLCLATAYLVALAMGARRAAARGYDPDTTADMFLYLLLGAVGGARITYVMLEWDQFRGNPLSALMIWKGGLVFYGGIIGGYLASLAFMKYHKVPALPMADLSVGCVAVGHMIGRVGCFLNGCCYGQLTQQPWGVTFPYTAGPHPRHPTQLYEIAGLLVVLAFLEWRYRRPHRQGSIVALYLSLYAVLRFSVEMLRGDDRGGEFFGLSISQDLSIVGFFLGLAGLWLARSQKMSTEPLK